MPLFYCTGGAVITGTAWPYGDGACYCVVKRKQLYVIILLCLGDVCLSLAGRKSCHFLKAHVPRVIKATGGRANRIWAACEDPFQSRGQLLHLLLQALETSCAKETTAALEQELADMAACPSPSRYFFICLLHLVQIVVAFRRVCYFTNWSRDLQQAGARFQLSDVEPFLCTHLLYAFAAAHPDNATLAPIVTLKAASEREELQRYVDFNSLKRANPQLRTMLSVGGSIQANKDFVQVVSTADGRRKFAVNTVEYLRTWGFDGLDIDWEYPGDPPDTKRNFTLLLQELRLAFQADATSRQSASLLLSVAAPVSQIQMDAGYEIEQVSSLVDFINLMAYDFHGSWNTITSFNSPLYGRRGDPRFSPDLSVNWAVQAWLQKGAEAEKLVLGIAGYGQSFTLQNQSQHGVGAPTTGPGVPGRWRRMAGQLSYFEVCEYLAAGGVSVWDDLQRVPYVYLHDQWVGYDNPDSIKDKVDFAMGHSLGGAMLWSLDMDDFRGAFCGKGRYPLLSAMVSAISDHFPDVQVKIVDQTTHAHPSSLHTPTPIQPLPGISLIPDTSTQAVRVTVAPTPQPGVSVTRDPRQPGSLVPRVTEVGPGLHVSPSHAHTDAGTPGTQTTLATSTRSTTTATSTVKTSSPPEVTSQRVVVLTELRSGSRARHAPLASWLCQLVAAALVAFLASAGLMAA